jgi:ribosomal protein L40E
MDTRYKENYRMSIKDNLEYIKRLGIRRFVKEEYKKHHCSKCGGLRSIHNRKCFKCDTITKLVKKQ